LKSVSSVVRQMNIRKTVNLLIALGALMFIAVGCRFFHPTKPKTWYLLIEVQADDADQAAAMDQTMAMLRNRLNAVGVADFKVQPDVDSPARRILIQLPTVPDRGRIKQLLLTQGRLEFREVISEPSPSPAQKFPSEEAAKRQTPPGEVFPYVEVDSRDQGSGKAAKQYVILENTPIVSGRDLRDAQAVGNGENDYSIHFMLKAEGANRLGVWSGSHINDYLAVVLNGEVRTIAYIKSQISDSGQIDGRFTREGAEDLALVLRSGALIAPIQLIKEGDYAAAAK
jgi:preprotein translocase subunit SecD